MPAAVLTSTAICKIMELYQQGMTDSEIARVVGVSRQTVTRYRNRNGLKANYTSLLQRKNQVPALWEQGLTDEEMAVVLGVSRYTVGEWRKKYGLPANRRVGNKIVNHKAGITRDELKQLASDDEYKRLVLFMVVLNKFWRRAKERELKPDINSFIMAYRDAGLWHNLSGQVVN